jgi:hypothetical protein
VKHRAPLLVVIALCGFLVVALSALFRLRLSAGDLFPEYSSLRADPRGTRALHDSLARLPRLTVDREMKSLERIAARPNRTVIIAGLAVLHPPKLAGASERGRDVWGEITWPEFDALDATVRSGGRVVITLRPDADFAYDEAEKQPSAPAEEKSKTEPEKPRRLDKESKKDSDKEDKEPTFKAGRAAARLADVGARWGAPLQIDRHPTENALQTKDGGLSRFPASVPWHGSLSFNVDPAAEWRVLYRGADGPVLIERRLGGGTIVLATDSYFLSNEALQRERSSALLAWLVGPNSHVTFDETHLGVTLEPGVAALAKQYGLGAACATVLLLAALFIWRQSVSFVPPVEPPREIALAYHPAVGLERLLRRSVPPAELGQACLAEWRRTATPAEQARVNAAVAHLPPRANPAAWYNAAVAALRKR